MRAEKDTMTTTDTPVRGIIEVVTERIGKLQRGYLADRSAEVAALARLRRGVGKPAGSVLDIIAYTHDDAFLAGHRGDEPTWAEHAAHAAMTLYALHQQSQSKPMHQPGRGLGVAVRDLAPGERTQPADPQWAIFRRFAMLGTADSFLELGHHLRGTVQLLRAEGVTLDYGRLALDLMLWQQPGKAAQVRLRWGRDFHFPPKETTK